MGCNTSSPDGDVTPRVVVRRQSSANAKGHKKSKSIDAKVGSDVIISPIEMKGATLSVESRGSMRRRHGSTVSRRGSDASLMGMLTDPVIEKSFKSFMRARFSENLVLFWYDYRGFKEKKGSPVDEIVARAKDLYNKYISQSATCPLGLDLLTRSDIEDVLEVDGVGAILQKSTSLLLGAFDEAHEKNFNELKFEYMPLYIVSDDFLTLEAYKEMDVGSQLKDALGYNINFIIDNPWGTYYFKMFLYDSDFATFHEADDAFELICEIEDYRRATTNQHRRQRVRSIVKKYGHLDAVNAIAELISKDIKIENDPPKGLLDQINAKMRTILEEKYLGPFRETTYFNRFYEVIVNPEKKRQLTECDFETVFDQLKEFKEERNLDDAVGKAERALIDQTFLLFLEDKNARYYFKKFSRQVFQEESYMFWLEVQHYKAEDHVAPSDGSFILVTVGDTDKDIMIKRAEKLVAKYIAPGSKFEINIPDKMKQAILKAVKSRDDVSLGVFEPAEKEILQLMERNMWSKFRESYFYNQFRDKIFSKSQKQSLIVKPTHSPPTQVRSLPPR